MVLPIIVDATWLDGSVQFNGQELRRADSALWVGEGSTPLGVLGGIARHNDNSLAVTVNSSDVVTVQPGAVAVPGNSGTANGVYRFANPAADTGTLTARNATNPRIDLVVARAYDTSVVAGHGAFKGQIEIITGTPAASPVAPTLPALAVELARITVPASGGGTATVDNSFRTYAAAIGGLLPVATAARLPVGPNAKWLKAQAIDTGREYFWDGTAWVEDGTWLTWTSTVAPTVNAFTTLVQTCRYTIIGRTVLWRAQLYIQSVGTASGQTTMTMPVPGSTVGSTYIGAGRESAITGRGMNVVRTSSTGATIFAYDNGTSVGAGWDLMLSGNYERA